MRKTIAITFLALGFLVLILVAAFTVIQLTASETGWFEQEFSKLSLAEEMGMRRRKPSTRRVMAMVLRMVHSSLEPLR